MTIKQHIYAIEIGGLVNADGDDTIKYIDFEYIGYGSLENPTTDETKAFFRACEYLEDELGYNTDQAKIREVYLTN